MKLFDRRKNFTSLEAPIMITPYCPGNCKFCFLNKDIFSVKGVPEKKDWEQLFNNVIQYIISADLKYRLQFTVLGGEIYCDYLLNQPGYIENLESLYSLLKQMKQKRGNISIATDSSIENVSDQGIKLIQKIRENYNCIVTVPFDIGRISNPEKRKRYFRNLEMLKPITYIGVLIEKQHSNEKYLDELSKYGTVYLEEVNMFDQYHFSYKDTTIPRSVQKDSHYCTSPSFRIITTKGLYRCASTFHRPQWIPEEEWNKLVNDDQYLIDGYQQVIDWYGCNKCEFEETCCGMCWLSFYAQKYVYNNRKCLYK
jgi:hypothetical protein